jgi:hypothetical protein
MADPQKEATQEMITNAGIPIYHKEMRVGRNDSRARR